MAQFAIDEILTTGIAISGFVFDVSNNIGVNGYVLTSTSSGVMWQQDSSNADISSLSGQIAATGTLLNNRINSLSGYSDATFATITNLAATGSTLDTKINTTNTNLAATGSTLDTKINTLSGYSNANFATILNLAATGSTLDARINSLSGYAGSTFLSGSGTQYYVPRWNTARELVTGSIYDLGTGIGIGTTSPAAKFNVYGGNTVFRNDVVGGTSAVFIRNWASSPSTSLIFGNATNDDSSTTLDLTDNVFSITNYGDPGSSIKFGTRNNSTADIRVTIDPSGRVGIGATNLSSLLTVGGAGSTNSFSGISFGQDSQANLYRISSSRIKTDGNFTIDGQGGGATSLVLNRSSTSSENGMAFNTAGSVDWYYYVDNGNNNLQIQRSSEIDTAPRVRFDGSNSNILFNLGGGNVGIGVSNPSEKLTITGAVKILTRDGANFKVGDGSNNNTFLEFDYPDITTSNAYFRIFRNTNTNGGKYFQIFKGDGTATSQTLLNANGDSHINAVAGNLGIGTDSPNHLLNLSTVTSDTSIGLYTTTPNANARNWLISANDLAYGDFSLRQSLAISGNPRTSGVSRFYITNNGNVGINQTSPAYKLDVNGTSRFANDILSNGNITIAKAGAYLYINGTNSDAEIYWQANGTPRWAMGMNVGDATENLNIYNYTTATTNFTILKANGNVGIGTASPLQKLQVDGVVGNPASVGVTQSGIFRISNTTDNAVLDFGIRAGGLGAWIQSTDETSLAANYPLLLNPNGGNVIIGNTTAYAGLTISDVAANDGNDSLAFFYRGTAGAHESLIRFYDFRGQNNASIGNNLQDDGVATQKADLVFKTARNSSPIERMRITNAGSLLIGDTTQTYGPTTLGYMFGVKSQVYQSFISIAKSGQTLDSGGIVLGLDTTTAYLWARENIPISFGTNNNEKFRISADGNLGIGTVSPTTLLSVGGAGSTSAASGLTFGGDASANLYRISDSRIKTDGSLEAAVGIISPTITSLSGNIAATGSVLDTKINTLSGYSNATFATITNLAATGSTLNARINSLSGYAGSTFLSGQGVANWTARWNGAKELITGSIYDLGTGVGIGTSSPGARLDIAGTTNFQSDTFSLGVDYHYNKSFAYFYGRTGSENKGTILFNNGSASNLVFGEIASNIYSIGPGNSGAAPTSNTLTLDNLNTRVGVGLASPQKELDVISSENDFVTVGARALSNGGWAGVHFGYREDNNSYRKSAIVFERTDRTSNNAQGKVHILNGPIAGAGNATLSDAKFTIDESGNIGIGTTVPTGRLHIVGSDNKDNGPIIRLAGSTINQFEGGRIRFNESVGTYYQGAYIHYDASNNIFNLGVHGNIDSLTSSDVNAISILRSNAYVGIGTTNPIYNLDVVGPATSNGVTLRLNDAASLADSRHILLTRASAQASIGVAGSQTNDPLWISRSSGYDLIIDLNGRVGLGIVNPATLLGIGGAGSTTAASGITFGADAQANLYRSAEDTLRTDGALIAGGYLRALSYVQFLTNLYPDSYGDNVNINIGNTAGNSWETAIKIKPGSYVGIGTTQPSGKLHIVSNVAGETVLRADGTNGTLFTIVDDLSDSLMSVNNSAGLPVLEVFADDRVVAGQYGSGDFVLINNKVGIGTSNPVNKLSVIGAASIGSSTYNTSAPSNGLIVEGSVGIGTSSPTAALDVRGRARVQNNIAATAFYVQQDDGSSDVVEFYRNATSNFILKNNGNVGVGIGNPIEKLTVAGNLQLSGSAGASLNINTNNLGNGNISFDGTTFTIVSNSNSAPLILSTSSTERMRIASDGKVGIGTSVITGLLNVTRNSSTAQPIAFFKELFGTPPATNLLLLERGNNLIPANQTTSNAGLRIRDHSSNYSLSIEDHNSNVNFAISGSKVLVGSRGTNSLLNVGGAGSVAAASGLTFGGDAEANLYRSAEDTIKTDGNLIVVGNVTAANLVSGNGTANYITKWNGTKSIANSQIFDDGTYVGVNTAVNTTYRLQVNGSFAATTKSFDVVHPTISGKRLIYASLEGPENGVYFRGKNDNNEINLPHYWSGLVHDDSITVDLTSVGKRKDGKIRNYSVDQIGHNKVYIYTDSDDNIYDYYYTIFAERKDVSKLVIERDME